MSLTRRKRTHAHMLPENCESHTKKYTLSTHEMAQKHKQELTLKCGKHRNAEGLGWKMCKHMQHTYVRLERDEQEMNDFITAIGCKTRSARETT